MPQHTFIVVTSPKSDRRSRELQQSHAKAHAARAGYRKSVTKSHVPVRRVEQPPARQALLYSTKHGIRTLSERVVAPGVQKDDDTDDTQSSSECSDASVFKSMDTAWQWINGTSADPFDIIPGSNVGAAPYALEFREYAAPIWPRCTEAG
jgi:hypothetical protein